MAQGASGKAIVALVLGILGIASCFPCGIAAIFVANSELRDIRAGASSPEGEGLAKAGQVLGWISVGGPPRTPRLSLYRSALSFCCVIAARDGN